MTTEVEDWLHRQCAEERAHLVKPLSFTAGGRWWALATDGWILMIVPEMGGRTYGHGDERAQGAIGIGVELATHDLAGTVTIACTLAELQGFAGKRWIKPPPTTCERCDGEGVVECSCESCGDDHEADCPDCGGSKKMEARAPDIASVVVADVCVNRWLLARVVDGAPPQQGHVALVKHASGALAIIGENWRALVMCLHKKDRVAGLDEFPKVRT